MNNPDQVLSDTFHQVSKLFFPRADIINNHGMFNRIGRGGRPRIEQNMSFDSFRDNYF